MGHAQIEGATENRATVFVDIPATEIVPEAKRYRWQVDAAPTGAAIEHI